jgi:hypothetical protein
MIVQKRSHFSALGRGSRIARGGGNRKSVDSTYSASQPIHRGGVGRRPTLKCCSRRVPPGEHRAERARLAAGAVRATAAGPCYR